MKHTLMAIALIAASGAAAAAPAPALPIPLAPTLPVPALPALPIPSLPSLAVPDVRGAGAALLIGSTDFPGGLGPATPFFLAGNTVDGFAKGKNGFIAAGKALTAGVPELAPVAESYALLLGAGYDTLLPFYKAADPTLSAVAAKGETVTKPIGADIVNGAKYVASVLKGPSLDTATLAGLAGVSF